MFQRALEETKLALAEAKDAERAAIQSFQDKTAKLEAYAKVFCIENFYGTNLMVEIVEKILPWSFSDAFRFIPLVLFIKLLHMHILTYLFLICNELDEIFSVPQACKKMSRHFGQMQAVQEQVFFFFLILTLHMFSALIIL